MCQTSFNCANLIDDSKLYYRTIFQTNTRATILVTTQYLEILAFEYILLKEHGNWKLDRADCSCKLKLNITF